MDNVLSLVLATDAIRRQQAYDYLVKLLDSPDESDLALTFNEYGRLFDGICQWINSSSFKVSLNGLDLICRFAVKLGESMRQYVPQFVSALFDRLGDNKEQVRVASHEALAQLMETVCAAQFIFDHVPNVFQSKQPRIREESLVCLRNALDRYGGGGLSFQKLMPSVTKLLDDPVPPVREGALQTLLLAYQIYGERFRNDLIRKNLLPSNKQAMLLAKFDQIRESNAGANGEMEHQSNTDVTDAAMANIGTGGMSQSVIVMKRTGSSTSLSSTGQGRKVTKPFATEKKGIMTSSTAMTHSQVRGRDDGSLDEDVFREAFAESIQKAQQVAHKFSFSSPREIGDFMSRTRDALTDTQVDWEKRMCVLQDFRFFVALGGPESDDFWVGLRNCEYAFQTAVRDLRSQLVKEASITIAFLASQLGETGRLDHFAEIVLPALLSQMHNSAKIMSTSAVTCVRLLVSGVQSPRLIPIIAGQLSGSRSAVIRRNCCELIEKALQQWPTHGCLDKQTAVLVDAVKRGLSDADQEARAYSRRAYWQLKNHFPTQADVLFGQLDSIKQKYILADQPMGSVRTGSAIGYRSTRPPAPHITGRSRSASRGRGALGSAMSEDDLTGYQQQNAANARIGSHPPTAVASRRLATANSGVISPITNAHQQQLPPVPSHVISAVPNSTASSLMTSSVVSQSGRAPRSLPFNSPSKNAGASPAQTPTTPTMPNGSPGNRYGGRSRIPISQSQPGSRSQSPSPRAAYITSNIPVNSPGNLQANVNIKVGQQQDENRGRSTSSISGHDDLNKQLSYRLGLGGLGFSSPATRGGGGSMVAGGIGDDNNSDAGSMCSDRSFGGISRLSDRSAPPTFGRQDYGALVNRLGSSAWEDRRAGLTELQAQLITGQLVTLSQTEVDRLSSVFTKLFNDPNKKVFALFLDVLADFVLRFFPQLDSWLFIMLTRLFTRYGAGDLLESVQNRVLRCIDVGRQCFPPDVQFSTVVRILLDPSQTQAIRAKVAILNYLQQLATYSMEPCHLSDSDENHSVLFRLVTWTCDVRSAEVRKASQGAIIALFNLNSAEFSQILMKLQPKTQQMAMAILQSHMQNNSQPAAQPPPMSNLRRPSISENTSRPNDHPEDMTRVRELIRETTEDILNLSRTMGDSTDASRAQRPPIPPAIPTTPLTPAQNSLPRPPYNPGAYQSSPTTSVVSTMSSLPPQSSIINQLSNLQSPLATDPSRRLAAAVTVLSSSNATNGVTSSPRGASQPTVEEKQRALRDLTQLARQSGTESAWQAEFKNVLVALSEVLLAPMNTVDDVSLRSTALQTLERITLAMPIRFSEYVDFVVLRVLDMRGFHPLEGEGSGASNTEVVNQQIRDVERCSMALASSLPAEALLQVLCPLIDRGEYPQNEWSIKMVTKAVERLDRASLGPLLTSICPGLVRAAEHTQSSVRKASIFCLVSLYLVVGEQLRQHLTRLSQVKTKLLNLYIERTMTQMAQAQARRENAASTRTANGTSNGHLPLSEANASVH